ncbi:OLC1v1030328C1 [Oldenlandia corymbosa var. corymbosa]|uniref:OLC1v1030328C1 n=1 Tax=Oldenlandia corymbosa var. corymbosa TaxID=529605 RepID=A0AAV1CHP7_OLDCO|nr:OLC1v1030328C1 [Oldenlandia corymbosa var. corymbosa]
MTVDSYHVAGRLASGEQINLDEAALAMLYRSLHEARHNLGSTLCGPIWLLHFLLCIYFPSLKPEGIFPVESGEPLCLGVQQYIKPNFNGTQSFKTVFESSPNIRVTMQQPSHDWWHKSFGNICHSETESGKWDNIGIFGSTFVWSLFFQQGTSFMGVDGNAWQNISHYSFQVLFDTTLGFTAWWGELSTTLYGAGYDAMKNASRIRKYVKPKTVAVEADANLKALMAHLEQTKATAYIRVDSASIVPDIPLGAALQQIAEMFQLPAELVHSTRYDQLKTLLSMIQASPIDEGMAAAIRLILAEATQKQVECQVCVPHIEEYHAAYALHEKNKLLSEQLVDQAAQLEAEIKKKMAEEADLVAKLEKVQARRVELESTLGVVVADIHVALGQYGRTTPNSPATMDHLHPGQTEVVAPVEGGSTTIEAQQDVPLEDEEPLEVETLQSAPYEAVPPPSPSA